MGRLVVSLTNLASFGDSFVYGNELTDNHDGSRAWPALAAASLGLTYHTSAVAGCGNEHIAHQFFSYVAQHDLHQTLVVINWTWMMRWDLYLEPHQTWATLGPTCVPEKLQNQVGVAKAVDLVEFYQRHVVNNEIWSRSRSLMAMYAVNQWLEQNEVANVQTYMDYDLFVDQITHYRAYKDQNWPDVFDTAGLKNLPAEIMQECMADFSSRVLPPHLQFLQAGLLPQMHTWQGVNFLDWARQQGLAVSERLHPLEDAHQQAAEFWLDVYRSKCHDL